MNTTGYNIPSKERIAEQKMRDILWSDFFEKHTKGILDADSLFEVYVRLSNEFLDKFYPQPRSH